MSDLVLGESRSWPAPNGLIVTESNVILWELSRAVNFWLSDNGDSVSYCNRLDLECAIKEVLEKGLVAAAEKISKFDASPTL